MFGYYNDKVNASKSFKIDNHKIQNQNLSKANNNVFYKLGFLGHFLQALGIIAFNIKKFSVHFFVSMSICMEKNQDDTCIFLLEVPLIKQFRDPIG